MAIKLGNAAYFMETVTVSEGLQLCSYETAAGPVYEGKWALFKVV